MFILENSLLVSWIDTPIVHTAWSHGLLGHRVYIESMTQETDSFQSSVERTEFETQPELMNMVLQHLNDVRNNGNISNSLPAQTYPAFYE